MNKFIKNIGTRIINDTLIYDGSVFICLTNLFLILFTPSDV